MAFAKSLLDTQLEQLARMLGTRESVWFVGSGFSRESGLPGIWELCWTMLDGALWDEASPFPQEYRPVLWETLKRLLIGKNYVKSTSGAFQIGGDTALEYATLKDNAKLDPLPAWVDRFLNFSRIAEVLVRSLPLPASDQPYTTLARLMGVLTTHTSKWDNPPSLSHHLLALLVLEGCIPTLFTTNYDGLIESACEEVGITIDVISDKRSHETHRRVSGPRARPVLYKIHGCRAELLRANSFSDKLEEVATRIVITDQQLLSWRKDGWARAAFEFYFSTHPFVFVGYTANDVVLDVTLNWLASEVTPGTQVFAIPELSFPFFQFFHQQDPQFDPLNPQTIIDCWAGPLMKQLFPKAIRNHFEYQALAASGRWIPMDGCNPDLGSKARIESARLIGLWAERAAACSISQAEMQNQHRLSRSAWKSLARVDRSQDQLDTFHPLVQCRHEFSTAVAAFAQLLIDRYASGDKLRSVASFGDAHAITDEGQTLHLIATEGNHDLCKVVLIPEGNCHAKAHLRQWLIEYFTYRESHGLDQSGVFAFITHLDVDQDDLKKICSIVRQTLATNAEIQIWARHSTFKTAG